MERDQQREERALTLWPTYFRLAFALRIVFWYFLKILTVVLYWAMWFLSLFICFILARKACMVFMTFCSLASCSRSFFMPLRTFVTFAAWCVSAVAVLTAVSAKRRSFLARACRVTRRDPWTLRDNSAAIAAARVAFTPRRVSWWALACSLASSASAPAADMRAPWAPARTQVLMRLRRCEWLRTRSFFPFTLLQKAFSLLVVAALSKCPVRVLRVHMKFPLSMHFPAL
mmetsp:Transcript_6873/g.14732  ORF Transcript_6873/g.14732 Transcript_6873/m.14732 type:complete len:229 (-) Transcript_6873:292-978(-)